MWPKVETFRKKVNFFNPSLKIARFYEDGHECSILQSLEPHWRG